MSSNQERRAFLDHIRELEKEYDDWQDEKALHRDRNSDEPYKASLPQVVLLDRPDKETAVLNNEDGEPRVFANRREAARFAANHVPPEYHPHLYFCNHLHDNPA